MFKRIDNKRNRKIIIKKIKKKREEIYKEMVLNMRENQEQLERININKQGKQKKKIKKYFLENI